MSAKKLSVRTGRRGDFTAASDARLDTAAAETDRLASLYAYGVLDTPPEEDFDRIVALAAEICGTPVALVVLIDADRQWYKARIGLDITEAPRSTSFCQYAIVGADDMMEVPDTRLDERFAANPLVTGEPHLRFYAAAVLRDRQGRGLGTLCVFDVAPRHLSAVQLDCLASLGRHVTALLEVRRGSAALAHAETALDAAVDGRPRRSVITLDTDFRVTGWSGDAERLYGYPSIAIVGRPLSKVLAAELTVSDRKKIVALLEGRGRWEGDLIYHRHDGSPVRVWVRVEARHDPDGKRIGYLARTDERTSPDIERLHQALDADLPPLDLATSSLALVGALHRAVASGGLQVHYQPKVSVATGAIEGFEALVRWPRADGTTVAPSDFVPLAEEIGIIDTIGQQVLRQACADAAGWPAQASGATLGVAVNVSGRQLIPGQLAATIAAALTDSGLPANRLTIEVTETALVGDFESAIGALREVKALGVRVAIDDFGTGYSSLGYLSRFPIDELKIDQSFVERLGRDAAVDAIVGSVIALGHTLGLRCTAEGVERDDQLDHLAALRCDTFQGYLFSPAVPNESVDLCVSGRLGVSPATRDASCTSPRPAMTSRGAAVPATAGLAAARMTGSARPRRSRT
jgi:diguanylate cyclase